MNIRTKTDITPTPTTCLLRKSMPQRDYILAVNTQLYVKYYVLWYFLTLKVTYLLIYSLILQQVYLKRFCMWKKKKHDPYDDDYPWKENFEEEEKSKTAATWSPFASFLMKVFIPIFVISAILSTIGFFIYNARLAFYSGMVCTISFAIWSGAFMSFKDNTGATYFYDEIL